jgi:hypothetical protein
MPNMTGHFSGRVTAQSNFALGDIPDHELSLMQVSGSQTASDANWNNAKLTYWGHADLIRGAGHQSGYFVDVHSNGDRDCGTFEGKLSIVNNQVTIVGTWKYTHGTGMFEGITGNGTFKGVLLSPTEADMSWEGSYQLAASKRVA